MSRKQKTEAPTDPSGELDREHLARIRSAEKAVSKWESKLGELKEAVKLAQCNLREAVRDLRETIADGTGRLPFSEGDASGQAGNNGEAWRSVSLEELGLPFRSFSALMGAEITTLGALADHTAKARLTDIEGIGEKAAEKIEKRLEQWWEKNPLAKTAQ